MVAEKKQVAKIQKKTTPVTYDSVSEQHKFLASLFRDNFVRDSLQVVYKSRLSVGSSLCPKRKTIKKLTNLLTES